MTVQTIKDRMLERAPNATRLMDKLCAKGYIERLPSEEDRRASHPIRASVESLRGGLKSLVKPSNTSGNFQEFKGISHIQW